MNFRQTFLVVFLLSFPPCLIPGFCGEPEPAPRQMEATRTLDLAQYRQDLQNIEARLDTSEQDAARKLLIQAPQKYIVRHGGRDYEMDADWLRDGLSKIVTAGKNDRAGSVSSLRRQLAQRVGEADALAKVDAQFDAAAKQKAAAILASREFHRVNKPELWQQWLQRALVKIGRALDKLADKSSGVFWLGHGFVWTVIGTASCGLAIWLYRRARRREPRDDLRIPIPFSASRKSWRVWLREAQEAAERGEFREAVHLSYWAAISRLEEAGSWPADRTRTPREYLSFLRPSTPHHTVLLALTRNFELIWYGNRPASSSHFEKARLDVEGLQSR